MRHHGSRAALAATFAIVGCSASVDLPTTPAGATAVAATATPVILPVPSPVPTVLDRPSVPVDGGREPTVLLTDPDPAESDNALAQLERDKADDEVIVIAEFDGCILLETLAIPKPDAVLVEAIFDAAVDCVRAFEYQAFFLVESSGVNNHGRWDYPRSPRVTISYLDR